MYPNQYCHQCHEPEPCVEVPAPPDCTGEPCEEIVLDTCVRYTGPNIPCLGIVTGANINQIVQIIANRLCDCCDGTVNCVVSEWSAWSTCVNGVQTRTRTVITPPQNGGTACPPLTETRECCTPVNCVVSAWGPWSDCVGGVKTRTRTVTTPASCGGTPCPTLQETIECSACSPILNFSANGFDCETVEFSFSDDGNATSILAELVTVASPTVVLQSHTFVPTGSASSYLHSFTGVVPGTYLVKVYKTTAGGDCDVVTSSPVTVTACPINCPVPEFTVARDGCNAFNVTVTYNASQSTVSMEYQAVGATNWTLGGMLTTTLAGPNVISVTGLASSTTYNVRVKTKCTEGDSTWVTDTVVLPACEICTPVENLTLESSDCETATVSFFDDGTATVLMGELFKSTNPTVVVDTKIWTPTGTASTYSHVFTGLTPGNYFVKLTKDAGSVKCDVLQSTQINVAECAALCPVPTNLNLIEVCNRTTNGITASASVTGATTLSLTFELYHVTGGNLLVTTRTSNVPGGGSGSVDFFGLGLIAGDTYEVKVATDCESFTTSTQISQTIVKAACRPADEECPPPTGLTAIIS